MSSHAGSARNPLERFWPGLMTGPELHLHRYDVIQQAGLFVQMPEGAYRSASFLDGRSFSASSPAGWVPFQTVKGAVLSAAPPVTPLHFIFHMGHTGSTLFSRLLDESGVVQPLREPLALRELAILNDKRGEPSSLMSAEDIDTCAEVMLRLWARCRPGRRCAILKATSSAARVGGMLMSMRPKAQAAYLSMAREPYLAVNLGGPANIVDVRGHAEERMNRLRRFLGPIQDPLHALSPGELVALGWLAESLTRRSLKATSGARLMEIDFDEFLSDIPAGLLEAMAHFDLPGGTEEAARLASSPALGRYAKAPEHTYSSQLRADVIRQSMRQHRAEIARGMAWLDKLANTHDEVAALFSTP